MRQQVPSILTTVMAIIMFLVIMLQPLQDMGAEASINRWFQMLGTVALFMGIWNLTRTHLTIIKKRRMNWIFSVWLLVVMYGYMLLGMIQGNESTVYRWFYDALIVPISSTMFAMVAFYIVSGAYRAFRVRNVEAAIMMICAVWVMLANVPVGDLIWSPEGWLGGMQGIANWLAKVPNSAVSRAISVGTFFGAMSTQLRIFLGIERRHLGMGA